MAKKVDVDLIHFFVFNSTFGPREGEEHKRIIYYHPSSVDIDTKIKNVGLCEAITKFTQTFTDNHCESLHTQKTRQLFYQPEPDFWMVMTLRVPWSQRVKEGQTLTDYHEEDVQDSVFLSVLRQSYKMFRLFNGTMQSNMEKGGVERLKQKCDNFFTKEFLCNFRPGQADIMDVIHGIHFLPLDKNTYMRIQCFINLLESTFSSVKYTAFLYNYQLVWSGLEQEDMRTLYSYLTTSLFPSHLLQELNTTSTPPTPRGHYGKFILGPPNVWDKTDLGRSHKICINCDSEGSEECWLLVYQSLSAAICLFINGDFPVDIDYCRKLDKFLGPQMTSLATVISEQYPRRTTGPEPHFRYVYFNRMNLAQKTTVHPDHRKMSTATVAPDVLRLLADLSHDLNSEEGVEDGETIVKTCSDSWVVAKKSDQREFYVVLTQKNANLVEINEEVKKLCMTSFSNIFFVD